MKLGNKKFFFVFLFLFFYNFQSIAEDKKISTSTLINLNELKPSFEEVNESNDEPVSNEIIQNKKKKFPKMINLVQNLLV